MKICFGAGVWDSLARPDSGGGHALLSLRAASACGYPPLWFGA